MADGHDAARGHRANFRRWWARRRLKIDRQQRILGLRTVGEEAAEKNVTGRDRTYLEAYARGVNAFIESHRDRLPLEFRLMCASLNALYLLHCPDAERGRYQMRPWTITDSFLIGASMVEDSESLFGYARALTRRKSFWRRLVRS